jgi:hypothetical protein
MSGIKFSTSTCLWSVLFAVSVTSTSSVVPELTFAESDKLLSPPFLHDLSGALGSLPCSGHGAILNVRGSWVCWLATGKIHSLTHACNYYANFVTHVNYSYYTFNNLHRRYTLSIGLFLRWITQHHTKKFIQHNRRTESITSCLRYVIDVIHR